MFLIHKVPNCRGGGAMKFIDKVSLILHKQISLWPLFRSRTFFFPNALETFLYLNMFTFCAVNGTTNCYDLPKDPVCDIDNKEHSSSCFLAHHSAKFAYRGPCLQNCRTTGTVCGANGKTYISECAAWAGYVNVDYFGPCLTIGKTYTFSVATSMKTSLKGLG